MLLDCCVSRSSTSMPILLTQLSIATDSKSVLERSLTLGKHSTTRGLNGSETMDAHAPAHVRIPWRVQPCFDVNLTHLDLDSGCPIATIQYI
jgi:hypothetical protein